MLLALQPCAKRVEDPQLRIRAADLIGLVLIGEAEFLGNFGEDLKELRALVAKTGAVRRRAA